MPEGMEHLRASVYILGKYPLLCYNLYNFNILLITKPLAILMFSFNIKKPKHDQFIVDTV